MRLFSLHLLLHAIKCLASLSLIFQKGELNFAHAEAELRTCKANIQRLADSVDVMSELHSCWPAYQTNSSGVLNAPMADDETNVQQLLEKYV